MFDSGNSDLSDFSEDQCRNQAQDPKTFVRSRLHRLLSRMHIAGRSEQLSTGDT